VCNKIFCMLQGVTGERFSIKLSQGCVVQGSGGVEDHGARSHALGHAAQQYRSGQVLAGFREVHAR
jgi:hypothetical protein